MGKSLIIPGADFSSTKINKFVGIEFERGSSNGGGANGYHKMIGSTGIIDDLFGAVQPCVVKNARIQQRISQTNWFVSQDGETVDLSGTDGSDIMLCYPDMYAILGGTDATYERWIFSDAPFSYEGDTAEFIPAFGECPDYAIEIDGKSRSVHTTTYGQVANPNSSLDYYKTAGFPTTNKTRAYWETIARAKNSNTSSNLPYFNATTLDMRVIIGMMYVECRTKDIISVFGNGISSNITLTDTNWDTLGGDSCGSSIRWKETGSSTYTYKNFGATVYNTSASFRVDSIFGAQSALKALDVQAQISSGNVTLTPVTNSEGMTIGGNTFTGVATIKKTVSMTIGLSTETAAQHDVEIIYHVPVWRGRTNLYGNIWSHLSGADAIEWMDGNTYTTAFYEANHIEDIAATATEQVTSSTLEGAVTAFGLSSYEKLGEITGSDRASGYKTDNMSHANGNVSVIAHYGSGASLHNYECAYNYMSSASALAAGTFLHKQSGFLGGDAYSSYDSVRYACSNFGPAQARSHIGSRFRVKLTK